jgi:AraC-like DNA-binding protein
VAGEGRTTDTRGAAIDFVPGGVVIHPPGVAHDQRMRVPGEDLCIQVGSDKAPPPELARSLYLPRVPEPRLCDEMIALAAQPPEMPLLQRLACHHRAAALFVQLVGAAGAVAPVAERPQGDGYAAAAWEYIRAHYRTMEEVGEAAAAAGIGYDHLRHCFRKRYGMSVKRWHLEVRVERAKDLLAHSNLPLKAVADLCGFRNERYFSTCFRRLTGRAPGRFRGAMARG